ncbi:NAD-dependent succinate-semialdehyde dehydrogenase [Achromobacter sp. F4_2707]|uniref:NAD-dependent succinate-semialdehyde dehydrogenase n=1 Tax=Achromobacter sp. F4_2707 TaxID=3114286 RepID=UPI0039C6B191
MEQEMDEAKLILNGEARAKGSLGTYELVNPSTEKLIARVPKAGKQEALEAVALASEGFSEWSAVSPFDRSKVLRKAADIMRASVDAAATDMTLEQGKPLAQAKGEWLASADCLDWFAEEGRRTYGRLIPSRLQNISWAVHRRPIGPVAAFTPWNFPAWTPMQKIAPALAAGCSIVLKPAEQTPTTAWRICQALLDAGLPPKALSLIWGDPAEISSVLVQAPEIRKLSLTGSTRVGRALAGAAGGQLKKVTMELGGHAPVIIARDADIARVVALSKDWKFRNAGQVCVSPTRFLVEAPLYEKFVSDFTEAVENITVGDGLSPDTDMGPLATPEQLAKITRLVDDAQTNGAQITTGGSRIGDNGWFFSPTVIADATPKIQVMNEEPFGPIALISRMENLDAAIDEANRLPVGLASYAFTDNANTQQKIVNGLRAGMLAINHFALALPETPFGGVLDSGLGSEGGIEGIEAYFSPFLVSTKAF